MAKKRKQRLGRLSGHDDACVVQAGGAVTWEGKLTPAQCKRFPSGEKIGQGSFATAYMSPDDVDGVEKVVKFTGDPDDARSAKQLLGKKLKAAVRVYDVAQLKDQKSDRREAIYAIKTERVQPLDKAWIDPVFGVVVVIDQNTKDIKEDLEKKGKIALRHRDLMRKTCEKYGADCASKVPVIVEAVEELYANGVFSEDLHAGNWGMRGDQPVVLDFGVSVSPVELQQIDLAGRLRRGKAFAGRRRWRRPRR